MRKAIQHTIFHREDDSINQLLLTPLHISAL